MAEGYDCNVVANNGADFIVADKIGNGKTPILISGFGGAYESKMEFDIDELCKENCGFSVRLKKTMQNIRGLDKDDSFIPQVLSNIQGFVEKEMPLCRQEKVDERMGALFDGEAFKYMVENGLCMCVERATMAQYICQQAGVKSYLVNSYAKIQNVTKEPALHAYVMYEDKGKMFVYDPANPKNGDKPRILDAKMSKVIFEDFLEATKHNKDSDDKALKNRVGFLCVDEENNQKFLYHSNCGIAGETITPEILKAKRDAACVKSGRANNIDNYNG